MKQEFKRFILLITILIIAQILSGIMQGLGYETATFEYILILIIGIYLIRKDF